MHKFSQPHGIHGKLHHYNLLRERNAVATRGYWPLIVSKYNTTAQLCLHFGVRARTGTNIAFCHYSVQADERMNLASVVLHYIIHFPSRGSNRCITLPRSYTLSAVPDHLTPFSISYATSSCTRAIRHTITGTFGQ